MPAFDKAYSRFITLAKVVLPLAALVLLSTLFLISRRIDPTGSIPNSEVDLERLAREQRITAPHYTGVTADGTAISVKAGKAQPSPDTPDKASASDLVARLEFPDGTHAEITSDRGVVDGGADEARLSGAVTIRTSAGYRITTENVTTGLSQTRVVADDIVTASGPLGELTAGRLEITAGDEGRDDYVLVFKGGVKLVYRPETRGDER